MAHAVALVPGFLGFAHGLGSSYFTKAFVDGLAARLKERCGRRVDVLPMTTLPFGSLVVRQERLRKELEKAGGASTTWHLVGHSTGGLDATLLAGKYKLERDEKGRTALGHAPQVSPRLRSIVTISAPHYGTTLANAPLAAFFVGPTAKLATILASVKMLERAVVDAVEVKQFFARLEFAVGAIASAGVGVFEDGLPRDLEPAVASDLTRRNEIRDGIEVACIATLAPRVTTAASDRLFGDLWRWTHDGVAATDPPPAAWKAPASVIASDPTQVPSPIELGDSDGVVDTLRQTLGAPAAALVVADHADVIGQYSRTQKGHAITGLLTSGATFGDAQFAAVLDRIAALIATAARD